MMDSLGCQPCHERIERLRAALHAEVDAVLAHHGKSAEIVIITKLREDERFADQAMSHFDRFLQWTLSKIGRAS